MLPVVVEERENVSFCEVWMSILHLFWQKEVDQYVNITRSLVSTLLKAALNKDSMFLSGILMSTTTEEHKIEVSRLVGWLVSSWWSWNPMSVPEYFCCCCRDNSSVLDDQSQDRQIVLTNQKPGSVEGKIELTWHNYYTALSRDWRSTTCTD